MEIKKTPVQIPLTWLHVWLLFAGIYGFAAGFLELTGREAMYFCAISLLMLIPAAASWILIRKTKALWQFLLGGIAVCAVTYLAAKFFCSLFSVQAAAVIEAAAAANDGKNKFENGISPAFLESLSGVMTGLMAAVIFLIRGYVRIRKGQLKKAAQELPAGSMPLADMEAWEIPTLLDEPKPLHFLWFMIQYVIGVLMKMPFYWHLIYWFFFADVFLCFFCQYLDGMHGFIRDHQKIANLPVETMQRTGKLILKIAVLLLVLFVLPSALYGKDPIAEAIAGYEPKELEKRSYDRNTGGRGAAGHGAGRSVRYAGGQRVQTDAAVDPESFYGGHVSCDGCRRNRGSAGDLPERKKCGKSLLRG